MVYLCLCHNAPPCWIVLVVVVMMVVGIWICVCVCVCLCVGLFVCVGMEPCPCEFWLYVCQRGKTDFRFSCHLIFFFAVAAVVAVATVIAVVVVHSHRCLCHSNWIINFHWICFLSLSFSIYLPTFSLFWATAAVALYRIILIMTFLMHDPLKLAAQKAWWHSFNLSFNTNFFLSRPLPPLPLPTRETHPQETQETYGNVCQSKRQPIDTSNFFLLLYFVLLSVRFNWWKQKCFDKSILCNR